MEYSQNIDEINQQIQSLINSLNNLKSNINSPEKDSFSESNNNLKKSMNAISTYLAIGPKIEEDQLLNMILGCAMYSVNAGGAGMTIYDSKKEKLIFRAAVGDGAEGILGYEIPLEGSQHGLAFATGDIQSSTPLHNTIEEKAKAKFKNVLVAPLFVDNEGVGTMSAVNKLDGNHFSPEDMEAYKLFSDLAALVVRQRLREEVLKNLIAGKDKNIPLELEGLNFSKESKQLFDIIQDIMEISRKQEALLPFCKKLTNLLVEMSSQSGWTF